MSFKNNKINVVIVNMNYSILKIIEVITNVLRLIYLHKLYKTYFELQSCILLRKYDKKENEY